MAPAVFEFDSYRAFLARLCEVEGATRGFRAALARAAACQPSYLSQALRERAHLTEDHLAGIALHLGLSTGETDFLLLLLRREKAGTDKLRAHLDVAVRRAREKHRSLRNRVKAQEVRGGERDLATYASSWLPSAVHLLTSEPSTRTAEAIARRLRIDREKAEETLLFLERAGFVEREGRGWAYRSGSLHISKDSPYHASLHATRRELVARSVALGEKREVHFSSVFTVDAEDLEKLRELAAKMLAGSHELIQKSGTKRLACLCLDLFEIV